MRDITEAEWTWLLYGVASNIMPNVAQIPIDKVIELLDLKKENDSLKLEISRQAAIILRLKAEQGLSL